MRVSTLVVRYKEFRLAGLWGLREPTSGTEIASSTSMEIRYVNPRFLPAFILMPPHSMLIVDERLRTSRRTGERQRNAAVATLLFPPLFIFFLSSSTTRSRSFHIHVVRSRCERNCNLALLSSVVLHWRADR